MSALRQLVLQSNHASDVLVFTRLSLEGVSLLLLLLELNFYLLVKINLFLFESFQSGGLIDDPLLLVGNSLCVFLDNAFLSHDFLAFVKDNLLKRLNVLLCDGMSFS